MDNKHEWKYCSLGGVTRVSITSGEDIARLGELDQKLWTVLSCPTDGLNIDSATLDLIDTDHDGKIKVHEVVAAAEWITSLLKDRDSLLKGGEVLSLDGIDTTTETGQRLYHSAKQILSNIGCGDKNEISVAEASDGVAIFKGTKANGDGIITPLSAGDDETLRKLIEDCIAVGGDAVPVDRSGEKGITADMIEDFYAACKDYAEWNDAAAAEGSAILPYGDGTDAAYKAFCAVKDKVNDYFLRCKLIRYNADTASAVDNSVAKISELGASGSTASFGEALTDCPLAKPAAEGVLPSDGINPAYQAAFDALRDAVGKGEFGSPKGTSEAAWNALCLKFAPFAAWLEGKKGSSVETLGLERVKEILSSDNKAALLSLVEADNALKQEAEAIDEVKKMMLLYRDFGKLLRNYVIFSDFYAREPRAAFEAGKLYLDQRCCDLCVRVTDMGGHADMAKLSGMFLIYCTCTSKKCDKTMDIVAVMTDGDTSELRVGKNGVFYDCEGNDYDAKVTKVVDNPVSIKQAFWSPYRKFWEFCVGLVNKSASDKDSKMMSEMQSKAGAVAASPAPAAAGGAAAAPAKQPFDIAKFAGIFAAIGLALGAIGTAVASIAKGIAAAKWWQLLLVIAAIMLVISGPSCFIAWSKLRKRNLGPVLNANGWAINSKVLVNILFGSKLTSVAKYPKIKTSDPYAPKASPWRTVVWIVLLLAIVGCVLYLTDVL